VWNLSLLYDSQGDRKYLNAAERTAFLEAIDSALADRQRAFCLLLLFTGCRISEGLSLTPGGLDSNDRNVVFQTLKQRGQRKFRAVPIPRDLLEFLQSLAVDSDQDKRLWTISRMSAWRLIKKVMAKANITGTKASPKGLRHGFAIACVSNGVPLPTLQKWLGHTRLETTSIYLDFVGEDERAIARKVWETTPRSR